MQIAHAMTSGDIGVHNGSRVNGITHAEYTSEVEKEFINFWNRNKDKDGKIDGRKMETFIRYLIDGKQYDGKRVNPKIMKYNQGILEKSRLKRGTRPFEMILHANGQDKLDNLAEILKKSPWKRRMAIIHSVVSVQLMGVFTDAVAGQIQGGIDALGDPEFQRWFAQAMIQLQIGNLNRAQNLLIDDRGNSCLQVLQEKLPTLLGTGAVQILENRIRALFDKYRQHEANNWSGIGFDWISPD